MNKMKAAGQWELPGACCFLIISDAALT